MLLCPTQLCIGIQRELKENCVWDNENRRKKEKKPTALISLSFQQVLAENLQFAKNVSRKGNARNAHKSKQNRSVPVFTHEASKLVMKKISNTSLIYQGFEPSCQKNHFNKLIYLIIKLKISNVENITEMYTLIYSCLIYRFSFHA